MFDAEVAELTADTMPLRPVRMRAGVYIKVKRGLDILAALALLPLAALTAVVLLVLNPLFNKGPLIYRQIRMGRNCRPFTAYKFRSMVEMSENDRGAWDALEEHRITLLGCVIRKLRLDELPQALNILKGDMSLVGPRPDYIDHARVYLAEIPEYRVRYSVRPGVTGLAQTEVGYVSDLAGFRRKVAADLIYIRNMSFVYDLKVLLRTVLIVLGRRGR